MRRHRFFIWAVSLALVLNPLFPQAVSYADSDAAGGTGGASEQSDVSSLSDEVSDGIVSLVPPFLDEAVSSTEDQSDAEEGAPSSLVDQTEQDETQQNQAEQDQDESTVQDDPVIQESTSTAPPEPLLQQEAISTMALDSNEREVGTFIGLKSLLQSAPPAGVDTIYLRSDIQIALLGITVNSGWTNLTIIGHPKDDSSTFYTIHDSNLGTTLQGNNILLRYANTNVTVRDAYIDGRNYYGTFTVANNSATSSVTITFDNVYYEGPQPTYNRYGVTRYLDSTLIVKTIIGAPAQEIGEVNRVEIGGTTRLEKQAGGDSMLWFPNNNSSVRYLKILDNSNVTVVNTSSSTNDFLYIDGTPSIPVTIGENASLSVTMRDGFSRDAQRIDSLTLEEGATLKVNQTGDPGDYPTIYINSSLTVGPGATLDVQRGANARSNGLIRFYDADGSIVMDNPRRVQLYNPNGRLVTWRTGSGTIVGMVDSINAWSSAPTGYTDSIDNMPTDIWNRNSGAVMKLSVTANTSTMTSLSLTKPDDTAIDDFPVSEPFNTTTFNTYTACMLVMGSYSLSTDDIHVSDTHVTGQADADASLKITYDNPGAQVLAGFADSTGSFQIAVPDAPLPVGATVMTLSHHDYLKARYATTVLEDPGGILQFGDVPEEMPFATVTLSTDPQTVLRQNANWGLSVDDTRGSGQTWQIHASIDHPLTATVGEHTYTLPDALVYVDSIGTTHALGSTPTLITEGVTGSTPETIVSWAANRGILVQVDIADVRVGIPYSTTIEWTLSDVP